MYTYTHHKYNLVPCSTCGSNSISIKEAAIRGRKVFVSCDCCHKAVSFNSSIRAAVDDWNNRNK